MCRFVVYKGREIFMADLITRPAHSLIHQSYQAAERQEPLNGDGFGVGWYVPEIDAIPGIFTSLHPAWSDRNLTRIADKTRSSCMFAHVRAATHGTDVMERNCHPFEYKQFLFMHNGHVSGLRQLRRAMRESLSDEVYHTVVGTTDSELIFAMYLDRLHALGEEWSTDTMSAALLETLRELRRLAENAGITEDSELNLAVTDGESVVVTRYSSDPDSEPPSLYLCRGDRFALVGDRYTMVPTEQRAQAFLIASEPITADRSGWERIPKDHLVRISPELHLRIEPIEL